MLMCNPAELSK